MTTLPYAPLLAVILNAILLNGFILGWSVAWPLGLGACSGDFCWALGVAAGAGALMNTPKVRLGVVSLVLLLVLARPSWQILTQTLTAVVMIYFAIRLAMQLMFHS